MSFRSDPPSADSTADRARPTSDADRVRVVGAIVVLATVDCIWVGLHEPDLAPVLAAAAAIAVAATWHDLVTTRIPNVASAAILLLAMVAGSSRSSLIAVAIGGAFAAVPLLAIRAVNPDSLGFGDVKFSAALGALGGLWWVPIGAVMVALTALWRAIRPPSPVPLAPTIATTWLLATMLTPLLPPTTLTGG